MSETKKSRRIALHSTCGAIDVLDIKSKRPRVYNAKCNICGHEFSAPSSLLLDYIERGYCGQCGLNKMRAESEARAREHIGRQFGQLLVIDYAGSKKSSVNRNDIYMTCKCLKCGTLTEIPLHRLKSNGVKQCKNCSRKNLKKGQEIIHDASQEGTNVLSIYNRATNKNSKTGVKGVCWHSQTNKYRAYIYFKRKQYNLGLFATVEEAAKARKEAEEKIFGEFLEWYAEKYPEQWKRIRGEK